MFRLSLSCFLFGSDKRLFALRQRLVSGDVFSPLCQVVSDHATDGCVSLTNCFVYDLFTVFLSTPALTIFCEFLIPLLVLNYRYT